MSANRLVVVLYGQLAGVIERAGGSLTFTYDDDYRSLPTATPLSLSMPLSGARYTNRYVEAHLREWRPAEWCTAPGERVAPNVATITA